MIDSLWPGQIGRERGGSSAVGKDNEFHVPPLAEWAGPSAERPYRPYG